MNYSKYPKDYSGWWLLAAIAIALALRYVSPNIYLIGSVIAGICIVITIILACVHIFRVEAWKERQRYKNHFPEEYRKW